MNNQEITDRKWMRMALDLAGNGEGRVHPNPLVGAVIVTEDTVIGKGWHAYCGGLHAERNALKDCRERGNDPEGATIYVTLEPCCHYGKTPPCTEAIIENGLSRVVFGAWDPNPVVAGKGIQILRAAGIETEGPVMEAECQDFLSLYHRKDTLCHHEICDDSRRKNRLCYGRFPMGDSGGSS